MSAASSESGSFRRVCPLADLAAETAAAVEVDGEDIAIVNSAGEIYAIADECSHAAIPLSEGDVGDGEIECYMHGSRFSLKTGEPLGLPATEPVAVYPVKVEDGEIYVDVDHALNDV
ncbi:non-heme iron oxygenase ferredoxin subunit [Microlunatus soli]|uniref:3-phenylpropionate/trans-cinnamate dioxygenase ferredoxin subunit n=1 Tax=Microlunatus soli TaxID=630515 RepID=A0A1H1P3A7_9ACTN|nr:non-heme iron oxygenase ferredoxin subunit [Microlunatus soli]SDS05495.1 3-phenylpropionate/trans-cinnamate dioxygenase ferredoxin subunit [Microlunatus soli]